MVSDESVVITAPSVEEAIILGLTRLTATREEVNIEVLDEGNRGFLGLGSREAKVRVTRLPEGSRPVTPSVTLTAKPPVSESDARPAAQAANRSSSKDASIAAPAAAELTPPASEKPAPASTSASRAKEASKPTLQPASQPPVSASDVRPAAQAGDQKDAKEAAVATPSAAELTPPAPEQVPSSRGGGGLNRARLTEIAKDVAENLLPGLDIETTVEWLDEERPTMWIALDGRDASSLVGPRARNLHAVQYLLRAMIYHKLDGEYNVVVDADGYRRRRRRSLESIAEKKADSAVSQGKTVRLRPMPAHERRIVHIVLRKDDRVTTESVGRGRNRAVTIIPKKSGS